MRTRMGMTLMVLAAVAWPGGLGVRHAGAAAQGPPARDESVAASWRGLTTRVPAAWGTQRPRSSMRVAQYRVPGAAGAGDAECVVFYFGRDQGGSPEANIARWESQFSSPDHRPVKAAVQRLSVHGMPVTIAELKGAYARTLGMGGGAEARPDQALLSAIVETPEGNLFVQLHGPAATVAAGRPAFLGAIRQLR